MLAIIHSLEKSFGSLNFQVVEDIFIKMIFAAYVPVPCPGQVCLFSYPFPESSTWCKVSSPRYPQENGQKRPENNLRSRLPRDLSLCRRTASLVSDEIKVNRSTHLYVSCYYATFCQPICNFLTNEAWIKDKTCGLLRQKNSKCFF